MRVVFVLVVLALTLAPSPAPAQDPAPSVIAFSPSGTVKQVRQVTARFSVPMVPLGDPLKFTRLPVRSRSRMQREPRAG